jgi:hypothetical protein
VAKQWVWVAVGAVAVAASTAHCSDTPGTASAPSTSATRSVTPSVTPKPSVVSTQKPWYEDYDPARFAVQVRKYAGQAGIRPQLLMAILYNESYKPHDPELERSWARIDSDPAFGIANMHRPAFDDTKRGRAFAGRKWEELPDDPSLAIQAAAWHLHDLAWGAVRRTVGVYRGRLVSTSGWTTGSVRPMSTRGCSRQPSCTPTGTVSTSR